MRVGIVGSESAKFTRRTEREARRIIREELSSGDTVISGACHLGGIDVWAIEEAGKLGLACVEYPPKKKNWSEGYKPRNIQIAKSSDKIVCIVVRKLPKGYTGMKFPLCYHCGTDDHVKSGGCWTAKYARKLGKPTALFIID